MKKAEEAKRSTLLYLVQDNLAEEQLLELYQHYASTHKLEPIRYMSELEEEMVGLDFLDAYRKIDHKNFSEDDEYYFYDSFGDIVSRNTISDCIDELSSDEELANHLCRYGDVSSILEYNEELMVEEFINYAYEVLKDTEPEFNEIVRYIEDNLFASETWEEEWDELLERYMKDYME